jgi:hypothetical protein
MQDSTRIEEQELAWAPPEMVEDEHLEPDAPPAGVRRNQQDTTRVDGEQVLHPPPGHELIQRSKIQG